MHGNRAHKGKAKKAFDALKQNLNQNIEMYLAANTPPVAIEKFEPVCYASLDGNQKLASCDTNTSDVEESDN